MLFKRSLYFSRQLVTQIASQLTVLVIMSSVTERRGTIGVVKGSGENESFQAKANFSLKIVAKVEGTKDGYIARVTRAPDNASRWVQH